MADFDWSTAAQPAKAATSKQPTAAQQFDWSSASEPAESPSIFTADNAKRVANAVIRAESVLAGPLGLAAPQFDVAPMEATGSGGAFVRGGQQGASMGFGDEEAGTRAAAQEIARGGGLKRALAKYRAARDAERGADTRAKALDSTAFTGGEIVGAIATPNPFGKAKAVTTLGKFGTAAGRGALLGGAYGLGSSNADLTRGDVGGAAVDTGIGAGAGALGGTVGEGLGQGVGWVLKKTRGRASKGIEDAIEAELAAQRKAQEKAERSAQGTYRSSVQSASRDLEVLEREAAELPDGHPLKKEIQGYLNSPEGLAVREQVAGNKMGTAPERISEMQQKLDEYRDLVANRETNIEQNTTAALKNPVKRHVLPRIYTLGHRFLPPAIATAGALVGGSEGALVGGAVGTLMSLSQGAPGRIVKNLINKPAVRKAFWERVLQASGGSQAVAGAIPKLEQAAAKGEKSLALALATFSDAHPEFRGALLKVAGGQEPDDRGELAANY